MRHRLSLDEIQERERAMFRLVDQLCRDHGLRYYLCGGTLLGAVRHGGFIPWDDDLDLLMPRPDYDKMQQVIRSQPLMPNYEFHSRELGNLNENFTKLVDICTEVEKDYTEDEYDQQLWIDLFPMDGLPDSERKTKAIYRKVLRARRVLKFLKAKDGTGKTRWKARLKPILKPIVAFFRSKESLLNRIDDIARTYDFERSTYVGGIVYGYGPEERMRRNEFTAGIPMKFEQIETVAPGCYEAYLTALYGDYRKWPPEEERQVHFMKVYGW